MNPENWNKIKSILQEVLALDPEDRQQFIESYGMDAADRTEVESLLSFEEESDALMHVPAVEFSKGFFEDREDEVPIGTVLGAYRIVREIGVGGMGTVYLAERNDGKFEQKVALKVLRSDLNTAKLRRRFDMEREILASLEHPNIARLLDAGTTEDKIPYLAMEFIAGIPITDYVEKHGLDLNERLDLFQQVCHTVGYAHRNLVVHRDLKPSNILVTNDGIPKLLDFGISKILSAEAEAAGMATVTRIGAMTPAYASPEQLRSRSVSTGTDIYSLGVILYELLTGRRPFEDKEADLQQSLSAVLEQEPLPPSAAIQLPVSVGGNESDRTLPLNAGASNDISTQASAGRNTRPNPIELSSHRLRGDIDNIVLKSLRKEPERRYISAEGMADDIERHQRGETVMARPNTFAYRAEKFLKRNIFSVAAAAIVMLALIGGVAATVWQYRNAEIERAKAEKRFNEVRTLANSVLFEIAPKIESLPGSTLARQLLVTRALEYLDSLSQDAGEDAELQRELAKAYEKVGDVQGNPYNPNIGDVKGALISYSKSLEIRERLFERDPNDRQAAGDLAAVYKLIGDVHSNGGEYSDAAGNYDKALELRQRIANGGKGTHEERFDLAKLLKARGLIPFYEGDNKKAIEYYVRAREIWEQLVNERPEDIKAADEYAYVFVAIGEAQGWDGDLEGAGANLQKGLDLLIPLSEKNPGDRSITRSLMLAYQKRGENHLDVEQFDKGVELYAKGLEIAERGLAADPSSFLAKRDVAMGSKKLAQALDLAGKGMESIERLTFALNTFKELNAADPNNTEAPYDIANTRFSIGEAHKTMKNHSAALENYLKAREEFETVLRINPANTYAVRMSSHNLDAMGNTYLALSGGGPENRRAALECFRAAFARFSKLKSEGKLGEVDFETVAKLEKRIAEMERGPDG